MGTGRIENDLGHGDIGSMKIKLRLLSTLRIVGRNDYSFGEMKFGCVLTHIQ